jgi:hypothetical protein
MDLRSAVTKINRRGILLVYPIQNRPEPASLWSEFYPRSKMRWEWDDGSDRRVAELWHLKTELSGSGKAVYAKWFQNRATFFSKALFPVLVAALGYHEGMLSPLARKVLRVLEEDSPLSTKELKKRTGLTGNAGERDYDRALKELWKGLFIVGYGEVEDGAFPSLAMGSSQLMFSEQWAQAQEMDRAEARSKLTEALDPQSAFYKYYAKSKATHFAERPTAASAVKGTIRYEDLIAGNIKR